MKITIFFILFWTSSLLASSIPTSTTKKEIEFKANLTREGFEKLRQKFLKDFKGEKSTRQDYYFDIFDNNHYLLKKTDPTIKLRFMWDGLDLKWQVQQTTKFWSDTLFSFKETLAQHFSLKPMPQTLESITRYHQKLTLLDPYALVLAHSLQSALYETHLLKKAEELCSLCKLTDPNKLLLYSSLMNTKIRVKIKVKIKDESYTLQVGETINLNNSSFELEAEVKNSTDVKKSAEELRKWLQKSAEFDLKAHLSHEPVLDPTLYSEMKLQELHKL